MTLAWWLAKVVGLAALYAGALFGISAVAVIGILFLYHLAWPEDDVQDPWDDEDYF